MELYINKIKTISNLFLSSLSSEELLFAEKKFTEWMFKNEKHLDNYFEEFINGTLYANRLYKCRLECFYMALLHLEKSGNIGKIKNYGRSIYSFGCGPGPEIAAYICYVRDKCCDTLPLKVTAVDVLNYWNLYICGIDGIHSKTDILFKNNKLNNNFLMKMEHSDICIMSYPHSLSFEDIWRNLQHKFTLIIILDQWKGEINNILEGYGFKCLKFYYNGWKKIFYFVNEYYLRFLKCPTYSVKCIRGLHDITGNVLHCVEPIPLLLHCGHWLETKCFDTDYSKCAEVIYGTCQRGIHFAATPCGFVRKCREKLSIMKVCGQTISIFCYENEFDKINPCDCQQRKVLYSNDYLWDRKPALQSIKVMRENRIINKHKKSIRTLNNKRNTKIKYLSSKNIQKRSFIKNFTKRR